MSRAFLLGVVAAACATAALAQSVPVRTNTPLPTGICRPGVSCEVASLTSTGTVQSDALSGQYAFKASVNGAWLGLGGGNAYLWAVDNNTLATNATVRTGGGLDLRNSLASDSVSGAFRVGNVVSFVIIVRGTLGTCASSASNTQSQPGGFATITGAAGKPTKFCVCTYDGTTYRWYNLLRPPRADDAGSIGDANTCPEAS